MENLNMNEVKINHYTICSRSTGQNLSLRKKVAELS